MRRAPHPAAALLIVAIAAGLCVPRSVHAFTDPIWHLGGGVGTTPGTDTIFEFSAEALGLRGGAGVHAYGPLRATFDLEHLFFQVPKGRMTIPEIRVTEKRSDLTTATLGIEIAPRPRQRVGPHLHLSIGAARVAYGDKTIDDMNFGMSTIDGSISVHPVFAAGIGFRARPSTGIGAGIQGLVRLVHVPTGDGDVNVVTTTLEVVF
jgi:hypothetical protein